MLIERSGGCHLQGRSVTMKGNAVVRLLLPAGPGGSVLKPWTLLAPHYNPDNAHWDFLSLPGGSRSRNSIKNICQHLLSFFPACGKVPFTPKPAVSKGTPRCQQEHVAATPAAPIPTPGHWAGSMLSSGLSLLICHRARLGMEPTGYRGLDKRGPVPDRPSP